MIMRACLLVLVTALGAVAGPPTQGERSRALSELHATSKVFLDSIAGLTEAQWTFKPAPDRWSIAACAEHIARSEDSLFQMVTGKVLKSPAKPPRDAAENRKIDKQVLNGVADRSKKAQAPGFLQPSGRFPTRAALTAAFKKSRNRTIKFIRETNEDLRGHRLKNPAFGELDAYQWILLISAHTARHTKQIEEVKEAPGYPHNRAGR